MTNTDIAVVVFGHERVPADGQYKSAHDCGWIMLPDDRIPELKVPAPPPCYLEGWTLGSTIIEQMSRRGYRLKLIEFSDGWYAAFVNHDIMDAGWTVTQELTPTRAIALAAYYAL